MKNRPQHSSVHLNSLPDRHPGPNTDVFYHNNVLSCERGFCCFKLPVYNMIIYIENLVFLLLYCINSMHRGLFEYTVAHFIQLQFQCWGPDVARFFLELNTMEEPMTMHTEESEIFFLSVWLYWLCRVGVWKQLSGLKTWAWNIVYLFDKASKPPSGTAASYKCSVSDLGVKTPSCKPLQTQQ